MRSNYTVEWRLRISVAFILYVHRNVAWYMLKFFLTNPTGDAFDVARVFLSQRQKTEYKTFFFVAGSWRCLISSKHWSCCFRFELSLACLSSCLLQFDEWLKDFLQCLHVYSFTPVWVRLCRLQFDKLLNLLSQCLHAYGFTSVWVCSCLLRPDDRLKHFLQCLHIFMASRPCEFVYVPCNLMIG